MLEEEIVFFIDNFVEKNRRQRCVSLFKKRDRRARDKFMLGLPRWIQPSCCHLSTNARDHYFTAIRGNEKSHALVTDLASEECLMRFSDYDPPYFKDELIISSAVGLAFFFHHHGGIWICRTQVQQ